MGQVALRGAGALHGQPEAVGGHHDSIGGTDNGDDEDDDASIHLPDSCGREVDEGGKSGTSHRNVINRLSDTGSFQIEQSRSLRDHLGLRDTVADGVAAALADLLDGAPANACAPFD